MQFIEGLPQITQIRTDEETCQSFFTFTLNDVFFSMTVYTLM